VINNCQLLRNLVLQFLTSMKLCRVKWVHPKGQKTRR